MNNLTLYECDELINKIDALAQANDGVITDEELQQLVVAQTTSIAKLGKLCGFMKYLEHGIALCKTEEERISKMRKTAENRLKSVKGYLLPYLQEHGKTKVDTFTLSTRKSKAVDVDVPFFNDGIKKELTSKDDFCRHVPESWEPDKKKIGAALKDGSQIQGCTLTERTSVQFK